VGAEGLPRDHGVETLDLGDSGALGQEKGAVNADRRWEIKRVAAHRLIVRY